jgi:alginate O-acetyltransferase complex protein AlgI
LRKTTPGKFLLLILVVAQVLIAWVFFRAESFGQAISIIKNMLSFNFTANWYISVDSNAVFYIVWGVFIELYFFFRIKYLLKLSRNNKTKLQVLQFAIMILLILFFRGKGTEFIYFQF